MIISVINKLRITRSQFNFLYFLYNNSFLILNLLIMHNLHTEDNSCATPQHKLLHGKHNINTQYKSKRENTYFSKKNKKRGSQDNDSYHNLYETTITAFFFLLLTICRLVYTQHKWLHLFLFRITLAAIFFNCPNPFTLKRYTHSFCKTFLQVTWVV